MPASRSSFSLRDGLLLVVLASLWGNSFLLIKLAVDSVPPVWIVGGRLTIGGLLLMGLAALRRERLPSAPAAVLALAVVGSAGSGLPWLGQAWAQQFLDSGLVAVLNATTPVATLAIAVLAGQEQLHRQRVLGLGVAVLGTLVVIGGEVRGGGPVMALVVAVLATFGYGLGTVVARATVTGRYRPLPAAALQLSLGAVVLNGIGLATDGLPPAPGSLEPVAAGSLAVLGLLGTGVAFLIYLTLIERVGATNASMVTYLVPIVGLVAGAVVRGERFGPNVLLGAAVLIGGVWLAQRRPVEVPDPVAEATTG